GPTRSTPAFPGNTGDSRQARAPVGPELAATTVGPAGFCRTLGLDLHVLARRPFPPRAPRCTTTGTERPGEGRDHQHHRTAAAGPFEPCRVRAHPAAGRGRRAMRA